MYCTRRGLFTTFLQSMNGKRVETASYFSPWILQSQYTDFHTAYLLRQTEAVWSQLCDMSPACATHTEQFRQCPEG